MSTSFLLQLQDPEVRKRFDARPAATRELIAGVAFDREVAQKFDRLKLTPQELEQAKTKFIERFTGAPSSGPLPEDFGKRATEAIPTTPIKEGIPAFRGGVMRGAQDVTSLAGMAPNRVSEFLGQTAEGYEKAAEPYAKEHPYKAGALELVGQGVPGIATEELAAPLKGIKYVGTAARSAAGMLPFSSTPGQWLAGTAFGVGLGKAWNKFFGPKGIKAAEGALAKAGKTTQETVVDAERRGILAELGVEDSSKTVAQLYKANEELVPKVDKALDALNATKIEAQATAKKEAKSLQASEKAEVKAQERAGKATEAFIKRFGHDPSPEQIEGLKAGGAKMTTVFEDERVLQRQLKTARGLLTSKRLQVIRKGTGKVPGEAEISQVRDAIKGMSIGDINKELEQYKSKPKPAVVVPQKVSFEAIQSGFMPRPGDVIVDANGKPISTLQELTQVRLATDVQTPELAAARPDIVKATEQANDLVQPPKTEKPREPFVVKVSGKDLTVLTDEEARQPDAAKKAIERIGAATREFIATELDERKQGPVVNKAIKLIEYLKQGGMDERLQKEGVNAFDDIGKPTKGAKIGRPTKAETTAKPPAVRAQETAEREAAALQEKRNEIAYAKASGKEISPSQISASGESRASTTGGAGRVSSYDEFEKIFGRPAEPSESFLLESGHSPAEAVDEAIQDEFEKSKEQ